MKTRPRPRRSLQPEQDVEDLRAHRGVEHRDRLVADQPLGLEHERRRDRDPLALAAGELVRVAVEVALGVEADVVHGAADALLVLALRHPLDHERLGDDRRAPAGADSASGRGPGRSSGRAGAAPAGSPLPLDRRVPRSATSPRSRLGCSPSIARASVDLPQPDSPTTPRISPALPVQRDAVERPGHPAAGAEARPRGRGRPSARRSRSASACDLGSAPRQAPATRSTARSDRRPTAPAPTSRRAGSSIDSAPRRRDSAGGSDSPAASPPGRAGRRESASARPRSPPITGSDVEQPLRVGVLRRVEDVRDRARLDDPARVHDRDPVAGLGQHPEVVGDQDQRQAELLAQALQQLQDLRLHDDVERRRRLVGDDQRRAAGEREGDHHPLALAARELVRVTVAQRRRQPDRLQQLVDPRADLPRAASARAGGSPRRSARSIRCTGSSEFIAPWKTSEMWRQRTSCIPRSRSGGRC